MSCIEEKHGNLENKKTYIFDGNFNCYVVYHLMNTALIDTCMPSCLPFCLSLSPCAAYSHAARALELDECSAEVHKWYGILAGAKGEFLSTKERIHNGQLFKLHIDRALEIKPRDATLHHLLGRFCYEVCIVINKVGCDLLSLVRYIVD